MAILPRLRAATKNVLLGLVEHTKDRALIASARSEIGNHSGHLQACDPKRRHAELGVAGSNRRREDKEGVGHALGHDRGLIELRTAWHHWDGSDWVNLASLPGASLLRKAEA